MVDLKLMVTLWPSFPHFPRFAQDDRLAGIRLNSAMITGKELDEELSLANKLAGDTVPLYFDIKGRQLRVVRVHENPDHLDLVLNHPISVEVPTVVLFKAGGDQALLVHVKEDGHRLIFHGGPRHQVREGESLHIRHPSLQVGGVQFIDTELEKIDKVRSAGFTRYFLSYVESQRDVDEFRELVGRDAEILLKIESKKGLQYVDRQFKKRPNLKLIAARGDLYVEIDRPHEILNAMRLIITKDPEACVGSRLMLSVVGEPVPSCADFHELAWLHDIGYRTMMLCDELCLKGSLLATAINAIDSFRQTYAPPPARSNGASWWKNVSAWPFTARK